MTAQELPDRDYELVQDGAWFGLDGFSIRVRRVTDGVSVDIYGRGCEEDDSLASCKAYIADLNTEEGC